MLEQRQILDIDIDIYIIHGCRAIIRLEAISTAGRDSGGQHDETGVNMGCSGGHKPSAGFITAEFIQENLLSPLPDKVDVNGTEGQVGEECSRGEREGFLVSLCRIRCWP